jgi:hypothetical protein
MPCDLSLSLSPSLFSLCVSPFSTHVCVSLCVCVWGGGGVRLMCVTVCETVHTFFPPTLACEDRASLGLALSPSRVPTHSYTATHPAAQ